MSYTYRFCLVREEIVDEIRDLDLPALRVYARERRYGLEEKDGHVYLRLFGCTYIDSDSILRSLEVFNFGRLGSDDTDICIRSMGQSLFTKDDTYEFFEDYDPCVVGKEGLLEAIRIYEAKITAYYKDLMSDFLTSRNPEPLFRHVRNKCSSISSLADIDEDEKNSKWVLTTSWEYEHSIFNLLHLLKSVDWEKYTLIFYGM